MYNLAEQENSQAHSCLNFKCLFTLESGILDILSWDVADPLVGSGPPDIK